MDEILLIRISLLKDAGEIDEKIAEGVITFVKDVEEQFNTTLTEENGAMLITHMCMSLARIKKGEEVNPLDDTSLEEVKKCQAYGKVPNLVKNLENNLNFKIPESEFGYMALHLCAMEEKNKLEGGIK